MVSSCFSGLFPVWGDSFYTMASSIKPQQISPRTEKWIRFSAIAVMFIVAVASMVLSFDGLRKLATEASISDQLAFLFPVIVDGTIIMASLSILRMNLSGQRAVLGWVTMIMGTGLSIAGNVISVRNEGLIAMGTHALPPILLATSLELFLSLIRTNIRLAQEAQEAEVKIKEAAEKQQTEQVRQLPASAPVSMPVEDKIIEEPRPEAQPVNLVQAPTINKEEAKTEEPTVIQHSAVEEPPVVIAQPPVVATSAASFLQASEQIEEEPTGPKIVFETTFEQQKEQPVEEETVESNESLLEASVPVETPAHPTVVLDEPVNVVREEDATTEEKSSPVETFIEPITEDSSEPVVEHGPEPVRKPSASRTKPDNENVVNYKKVLEKIKPEASRNSKIAAILNRYPDAKANDMKKAIGDPLNTRYDESIKQAKAFLAQRAQQKQKVQ